MATPEEDIFLYRFFLANTFKNLLLMNHLSGIALTFGREHPWGKDIQLCSKEIPRVMYGLTPRSLNFYIVIYKEMLKNSSSHESLTKHLSIVELDPQALLTIGTYIVKKRCCIHYDVRRASMPVRLLL